MALHYKNDGSLDMRYSSSCAASASSSSYYSSASRSSAFATTYGGSSSDTHHYKKDGSLDMRYNSSRTAAASPSPSYASHSGGGQGSSSRYYSGAACATPTTASGGSRTDSLHYKKDGTLDMRYSSSQAAMSMASKSPFSGSDAGYSPYGHSYSGQSTTAPSLPPPAPTPSSGLYYKKDGTLDMRYSSSQAAVAAATTTTRSSIRSASKTATPKTTTSTDLNYKKDGTLDMRYKSSQEVVARQLQQLDLAAKALASATAKTKRSSTAAQRPRSMGIPSHVPVTKAGYPDLRTRAAKDYVASEARAWHDAAPLPSWLPRLKDGTPDTTKTATRTFFRSAAPPPPPRRDAYYAERLLDAAFQRLVERERTRDVPRVRAPALLPATPGTRLALDQLHQPADAAAARVPVLPSSVQQLDYAQDLVVNEADAPLGRGSFGVVLRGSYRGTTVAIKRLHAPQLSKRERKVFSNETLVLGVLGAHPNIVQLVGYTLSPPALVMEFVPRGSLSFVLHYCEDAAVEAAMTDGRVKLNLLLGIVHGMAQLHACGVTHGDLKPQNVLVSKDFQAKIADFGLATLRAKTSSSTSSHVLAASGSMLSAVATNDDDDVDQEGAACGTAAYMAPELLNPLQVTNERTDVYSFGVLMNELLHEEEPYYESLRQFAGKGLFAAVLAAMNGQRPVIDDAKVTPELKRVIERCWSERASRRPTFEKIAKYLARCSGVPNSCA